VVKALRYKPASRGFDSRWCQWNFSVTYSFRSHYGPGVDSASNRVPGVFLGGKGGRYIRLTTLPPSCAVVMISGSRNFLEPSGLLQDCNGTALPLPVLLSELSYMFLFNNQPDALIIQIYSAIKLYMFRAFSLPIIRSFLLYIRNW